MYQVLQSIFMNQRLVVEADDFGDAIISAVTEAVRKVEPDCEVIPL